MTSSVRGFILQPTYRIEGGRPVVHLYGRLETGETFLVRDDRETPHFWVPARCERQARALGAKPLAETDSTALGTGEPVLRVEIPTPPDTPPLRDRLHQAGIPTFEADVRFAIRYLILRGLRGAVAIYGAGHSPGRRGAGVDRVFENPRLEPASWSFQPAVLSFDIETDPKVRRLLSIALFGCGASEVMLFTPKGYSCPEGAIPFPKEKALLAAFCQRVRELNPDVIVGWNVIDFDLSVLAGMAERWRIPFELGRGPGAVRIRSRNDSDVRGSSQATIQGRVVLDGPQLLRGSSVRMERYSLDWVSREVLGEGKLLTGSDRAGEILESFKHERQRFVDYNLTDARLALEILEKLGVVRLAVERSRLTGLPLDRVAGSIASFDFLYLMELGKRRVVAPTVGAPGYEQEPHNAGGHVLEPVPGLYENILTFDFKSLYPSLIRTFGIDPVGFVPPALAGEGKDLVRAPNGAAFRREAGILPAMLDELFPRREAAKQAGDKVASQAIKILMNSFYGVLGTAACRFHNGAIASAITSFGKEMLLWTKGRIESRGHRVLYGDTDSLFVELGEEGLSAEAAQARGEDLVAWLNTEVAAHVAETWGVESRLELEFERLYLKLFLPVMRHSTAGARKRYAGLIEEDGTKRVVFTGMEVVRRDWTELARRVQRELYQRLFLDQPVEAYLKKAVADLRSGAMDDLLIYTKALRKPLDSYTSTSPPHVVAARKLGGKPRRLVSYVITANGPEPAEAIESPLDHEHYVDKQVKPVAEPVLAILGLEFKRVVGDDRQLSLF